MTKDYIVLLFTEPELDEHSQEVLMSGNLDCLDGNKFGVIGDLDFDTRDFNFYRKPTNLFTHVLDNCPSEVIIEEKDDTTSFDAGVETALVVSKEGNHYTAYFIPTVIF